MLPRQRRRLNRAFWALVVFLIIGFSYGKARTYFRAILVLNNLSTETGDANSWVSSWLLYPVKIEDRRVRIKSGSLRARLFRPLKAERPPGIVLAIGVHYLGIDEPRAVSLAKAFASAGITVLAVEFPELMNYRFERVTVDSIALCAQYLAKQTGRAASGVFGISVAGSMALLAAADPALQKPIGFVATLGAYCDLNRVARYFAGEATRGPSGHIYPVRPHPYGPRVMLFGYLDRLFSPEDLEAARETLLLYLHDRHREARLHAKLLSESGRQKMMTILDENNVKGVEAAVRAATNADRRKLTRVSPCGQLGHLKVPVYLIHGENDPVIPSTETLWLAREVPQSQLRSVLVSKVLRHAELGHRHALSEYWKIINLFADLLSQAHRLPYR